MSVTVIKTRKIRNSHSIFVGKPEGKETTRKT